MINLKGNIKEVKNLKRKTVQKIFIWVMLLVMVGSVVASILAYVIR